MNTAILFTHTPLRLLGRVLTMRLLRPIAVLHEAPTFCVVSKPAGIMVHRNKFSKRDEAGVALLQNERRNPG